MAGNAQNIELSPTKAFWQIEAQELLSMAGLSNPDGLEFNLYKVDGTKVRLVFDLDAGSTIPSAGAGEIVIEAEVTTGMTEAQIAGAVQAALDGDADMSATVSSNEVTVTRAAVGEVTDAADVDSGVTITTCRRGKDFDLGLLQGNVELNFSPALTEVTANQFGATTLAQLYQGIDTLEVSTVLQETKHSKLKELFKIFGGAFTPAAGTEVFGAGTSRIGQNLLVEAGRLILRPQALNDESQDKVLMLALPVPDTLSLSGEEVRTLSVTWQGFPDTSKDARVDSLLFGDATQTGI